MLIKNINSWMDYAELAWSAAGRPSGLDPHSVMTEPLEYDHSYYEYFEKRYLDLWMEIYARVNPDNGTIIKKESIAFKKSWKRNFQWQTVWKQTLPFLVYGSNLGVRNEILIEIASLYCLGQAIPSMVIDRIMDNANPDATSEDPAFCILSFIKFLQGLHKLRVPCVEKLENSFIELTIEMYEKMLIEHDQRFEKIPNFLSDAIKDYLSPQSRLLSSIFFGVLTIWAHALANKIPSASIIESTEALRCVRQLNDEIVDVYDDILNGLFTLPWLYALEERSDLREKVNKLWADTKNHDAFMECERILKDTSGMERAASKSLEILSKSMTITMESFKPEEAFDISIIHNIRWALINSLEQLEFNRESRIVREPCLPQDTILNIKKPLEPIPGGGVLVFRDSNSVLMTLVLKRGMLRWELPAGVCKENESLEETAQRETLEETGKHVEIGDFVAVCWHYSRNLGKGWMGMIYQARVSIIDSIDDFMVISPEAFAHSKFSIKGNPELYQAIEISKCDFDELNRLCETQLLNSTAHESVVASGFVDWTKIPTGRIHPLHRKLIEAYRIGEKNLGFLISDADDDFKSYDGKSKLYYKN